MKGIKMKTFRFNNLNVIRSQYNNKGQKSDKYLWAKDIRWGICQNPVMSVLPKKQEKVMNEVSGRGHYGKRQLRALFSHSFSSQFGRMKFVGPGENFFLGFSSSIFSSLCQIVENTIFHPIFLPMFSILPKFIPTKHSVRDILSNTQCAHYELQCKTMNEHHEIHS